MTKLVVAFRNFANALKNRKSDVNKFIPIFSHIYVPMFLEFVVSDLHKMLQLCASRLSKALNSLWTECTVNSRNILKVNI